MKNIILVRPYIEEIIKQATFPLGLGYLASSLRESGYNVKIFDLNLSKTKNPAFIQYISNKKLDYIGITALTKYYHSMVELSNLIKKDNQLKSKTLIIGGVHISALPEISLRETKADVAVIGEGEITIVELLKTIDSNKNISSVNGIAYLDNDNNFIQTQPRELIKNLDDILPPAWDLIHPEKYPDIPHGFFYKKSPIFPIFSTRGCPFPCIYCSSKNFWKQRIRYHSAQRIVDEIEYLVNHYGAKEIHFWDDNLTLKTSHVLEFSREIKKRNIKMNFGCPNGVKIDTLNKSLLKIMRSVGFYMLIFAVEVGTPRIQKMINKNLDIRKIGLIIKDAKRLGYFTRGFFMMRLPSETIGEIYKTITLSCKLKLDHANYFIFSPLPGSDFFNKWKIGKELKNFDWNYDFFRNPTNMEEYSKIDSKNILKLQHYAYVKFFLLRPWKLLKYLMTLKPSQYLVIFDRILFAIRMKT